MAQNDTRPEEVGVYLLGEDEQGTNIRIEVRPDDYAHPVQEMKHYRRGGDFIRNLSPDDAIPWVQLYWLQRAGREIERSERNTERLLELIERLTSSTAQTLGAILRSVR